jgi:hypothetical protein
MTGSGVYLQSWDYVINSIYDVQEMQKGNETFCDSGKGVINFIVSMYHQKWECRFAVEEIGKNRCRVTIGIGGDVPNHDDKIRREFALLDTMLVANTEIEFDGRENAEPVPVPATAADARVRQTQKKPALGSNRLFLLAAACLAVAVIGVGAFAAISSRNRADDGEMLRPQGVPRTDAAEPSARPQPEDATGEGAKIVGYTILAASADDADGAGTFDIPLRLLNPEGSGSDYAFEIAVGGETLYASGLVGPGMCIEGIKLSKGLPKGDHEATLKIRAFKPGSATQVSGVEVVFTVVSG